MDRIGGSVSILVDSEIDSFEEIPMRSVSAWAMSASIPWLVAGSLVLLAARHGEITAQAQDAAKPSTPKNANTGYSLDSKTKPAKLKFKTKRDATTCCVVLEKTAIDPATINIKTTLSQVTAPPAVKVIAMVTYPNPPGLTGQYTVVPETKPSPYKQGAFAVDLTQFAQSLVTDVLSVKPAFDPIKDLSQYTPITVKFQVVGILNSAQVPAAPPNVSTDPATDVDGDFTISLQQVVGELGTAKSAAQPATP